MKIAGRTLLSLAIWAFAAVLSLSSTARAQMGPIQGVTTSANGLPRGGVSVAVCATLTTTGASVTSNVATLTFASNPTTAGFVASATLTVSGFTGGDTFFNSSFTISATSSTTISFPLTHANASAGTNGVVYQTGSSTQACAPLSTLYTDNTGGTTTPNPFTSDGLGNYLVWAAPNYYRIQLYGSGISTFVYPTGVPCVPANTVNCGVLLNAVNAFAAAATFPSINGILYVGVASGQYASLQAAHDALPSTGGTVLVTATGTPFGAGTTTLAMTKPMHIILDDATFTYTGSAQAILCTSVNTPIIEGSGFQGGGSAGGRIISVTNTAANGFDINVCPGAQIRNLNIVGPGSGTGKGLIFTGNTGVVENTVVKSFGGNGCEEDGTRGNSNGVRWVGARCVSNGGIGLNVFGANANVNHFMVEVSSNTGLGAQIATSANVFELLHGFSNNSGGTGFSFISPAGNNSGVFYSDSGTQTTDLALGAGASNNGWLRLVSGQTFTNAGTNNFIQTSQALFAAGSAATPGQSFIGSPTTGFYDVGGGALGFSSGGTPSFLYNLNIHRMGVNGVFGWSSNADPTAAGNDTGLSHGNTGLVAVGTGAAGSRAGKLAGAMLSSDGGTNCTNGELALSAGWQSTGSATVTAVQGSGAQTCMWTITTGTTTGANPTVTDTLTTALVSAGTVCEMNIHGGTHTAAAGEGFVQTSFSTSAPVFTFQGTPTAGGTTYFVTRRCGP